MSHVPEAELAHAARERVVELVADGAHVGDRRLSAVARPRGGRAEERELARRARVRVRQLLVRLDGDADVVVARRHHEARAVADAPPRRRAADVLALVVAERRDERVKVLRRAQRKPRKSTAPTSCRRASSSARAAAPYAARCAAASPSPSAARARKSSGSSRVGAGTVSGRQAGRRVPGRNLRSRSATRSACCAPSTSTSNSQPRRGGVGVAPLRPHLEPVRHRQRVPERLRARDGTRTRANAACTSRALREVGQLAQVRVAREDVVDEALVVVVAVRLHEARLLRERVAAARQLAEDGQARVVRAGCLVPERVAAACCIGPMQAPLLEQDVPARPQDAVQLGDELCRRRGGTWCSIGQTETAAKWPSGNGSRCPTGTLVNRAGVSCAARAAYAAFASTPWTSTPSGVIDAYCDRLVSRARGRCRAAARRAARATAAGPVLESLLSAVPYVALAGGVDGLLPLLLRATATPGAPRRRVERRPDHAERAERGHERRRPDHAPHRCIHNSRRRATLQSFFARDDLEQVNLVSNVTEGGAEETAATVPTSE